MAEGWKGLEVPNGTFETLQISCGEALGGCAGAKQHLRKRKKAVAEGWKGLGVPNGTFETLKKKLGRSLGRVCRCQAAPSKAKEGCGGGLEKGLEVPNGTFETLKKKLWRSVGRVCRCQTARSKAWKKAVAEQTFFVRFRRYRLAPPNPPKRCQTAPYKEDVGGRVGRLRCGSHSFVVGPWWPRAEGTVQGEQRCSKDGHSG